MHRRPCPDVTTGESVIWGGSSPRVADVEQGVERDGPPAAPPQSRTSALQPAGTAPAAESRPTFPARRVAAPGHLPAITLSDEPRARQSTPRSTSKLYPSGVVAVSAQTGPPVR